MELEKPCNSAGIIDMGANYNKLFKLMIGKIRKVKFAGQAGISGTTLAKLSRGENVDADVLIKICKVLDCDTGDIMVIEKDD